MNDFSTLENILTNPRFPIEVDLSLARISTARKEMLRKANEENFNNKVMVPARLKRGPYDVLEANKLLDSTPLISEFRKIADKTTLFTYSVRNYISEIMRISAQQMIIFYHLEQEKAIKEAEAAIQKPKVSRARKTPLKPKADDTRI